MTCERKKQKKEKMRIRGEPREGALRHTVIRDLGEHRDKRK